jgi:hypothetical protein
MPSVIGETLRLIVECCETAKLADWTLDGLECLVYCAFVHLEWQFAFSDNPNVCDWLTECCKTMGY